MTRKHLIPVFFWLVLSTAASAASPPPATTPQKAALSDAELERAIRARLAASKSAADKFTARVQGGVATLEGRTDVIQHKGSATRMAKSAGSKKVVNKIQVSDAAKEKATGGLTTGRRRVQVKRSEAVRK